MSGHTPGPWAWMGNQHGLYLATTHSGRQYVMGFRRKGFNGAQPVFREGNQLVPASALVKFEVGDGKARGFDQGADDETVYRYDVSDIDNADARLIAAAPDLLAALIEMEAEKADYMRRNNLGDPATEHTNKLARAAIAKATGNG